MERINLHHIIFSPKYRRPIFQDREDLGAACERLIRHICTLKNITVHAVAIETDHVHVFIQIPNTMSVAKAAMLIKWFSSRWMRIEFPELQSYPKKTAFWQRKYWNRSVGGDARTVKKYIKDQGVNTS
ncbi:MAG: IS200/IS605 family transposase [Chloroflexota bacterium]